MLRLIWIASIHIRHFMRRYMPTNILLNALRTRRGLKWGVPAMLLALPYLYAASLCTVLVGRGGPGWLYLIALVCVWNALKLVWIGPVSVALLVRRRKRHHLEPIAMQATPTRKAYGLWRRRFPYEGSRRVVGISWREGRRGSDGDSWSV